jgi:hypothetical protein
MSTHPLSRSEYFSQRKAFQSTYLPPANHANHREFSERQGDGERGRIDMECGGSTPPLTARLDASPFELCADPREFTGHRIETGALRLPTYSAVTR